MAVRRSWVRPWRQHALGLAVLSRPDSQDAVAAAGDEDLAVGAGSDRVLITLGAGESEDIVLARTPVQAHRAIAGTGQDLLGRTDECRARHFSLVRTDLVGRALHRPHRQPFLGVP